jgi:ABC-type Fe3+/spermidine/putrescine transport system ATPase subunit
MLADTFEQDDHVSRPYWRPDSNSTPRLVSAFFFRLTVNKILQIGGAEDLYHSPESRSVGEFLGSMNEFPGMAQLVSRLFLGDITLYHLSAHGIKLSGKTAGVDTQLEPGSSVYVRLPAEKLKIFPN